MIVNENLTKDLEESMKEDPDDFDSDQVLNILTRIKDDPRFNNCLDEIKGEFARNK